MKSKNKYEAFFQEGRGVCGEPTKAFTAFFDQLGEPPLDILDLGCGQGRDALVLARMGHQVLGVDLVPTGVQQMVEDGEAEGLSIRGAVADVTVYEPGELFDAVIIDRVLHMLRPMEQRIEVFEKALGWVRPAGHILLADERKNTDEFERVVVERPAEWELIKRQKGYLLARRLAPTTG